MKARRLALLSSLALAAAGMSASLFAADAATENWPRWRGPMATGEAPAANPPVEWSDTKNVKWKLKLPGVGHGTPIVWGDKIFIQTAINTNKPVAAQADDLVPSVILAQDRGGRGRGGPGGAPGGGRGGFGGGRAPTELHQFSLLCIDRNTGNILWQKTAKEEVPHEGHHQDHGYSSYSAVTDGSHVYASFGSRGVYCYDLDGNLKWQKDLGKMQTKMGFGEGSSPALADGVLVINWDHEGPDFIVALDAKTGDELWRQARDEDTSWSTPLVVEHAGQKQVITTATKRIRSYDLKTGKMLWEHEGLTANTIPTAVSADGVVFAMSGFRGAELYAIKLGKEGDLTGSDSILWSHNRGTPYVPSPLLYQHRLYFFSGNNNILTVLDAKTGKAVMETERVEGISGVYASPVGAAGRVYLVGRDGTTVVIKASDKLEVLATNKLGERVDASPAVVGNQILIRGHQHLYCIAEK